MKTTKITPKIIQIPIQMPIEQYQSLLDIQITTFKKTHKRPSLALLVREAITCYINNYNKL